MCVLLFSTRLHAVAMPSARVNTSWPEPSYPPAETASRSARSTGACLENRTYFTDATVPMSFTIGWAFNVELIAAIPAERAEERSCRLSERRCYA